MTYIIRTADQSLSLIVTPSPFEAVTHSLRKFFSYESDAYLLEKTSVLSYSL